MPYAEPAALRSASSRLNKSPIWFQLANVRVTTFKPVNIDAICDLAIAASTSAVLIQRRSNAATDEMAIRAADVTVPAVDVLIFACAKVHGLEVAHNDTHFDELATLEA